MTISEPDSFQSRFLKLGAEKIAWLAGLLQGEAYFHMDKRVRAKSENYTPVPSTPQIKLEMIQKDLMEHVGECLEEDVVIVVRKTTADNTVYKVTVTSRDKVETILKSLLPYIIGTKTRTEIEKLLEVCDEYHKWKQEGGKSKAAKLANLASQKAKRKEKEKEKEN